MSLPLHLQKYRFDIVFLTAAFWYILLHVCGVSLPLNFCHISIVKTQMMLFAC